LAVTKIITVAKKEFEKAMDDDFSTPNGWAALDDMQRKVNGLVDNNQVGKKNAVSILNFLKKINEIFVVFDFNVKRDSLQKNLMDLIIQREKLRNEKKWDEADKIRDKLLKEKIQLMDTNNGTKWKKL